MKLKSKPLLASAFLLPVCALLFYACQKESVPGENAPAGKSRLSVYLTDGPYDFEKVLIDIRQVAVKLDTCKRNHDEDEDQPGCDDDHDRRNGDCEVWDTLDIEPGVYDLVQLRNGVDTLLASDFVLKGKVKRIKITLGSNNSVTVDGTDFPLQLLNNQDYIFVNIKREYLDSLSSDNFQMFLDFNLAKSIKFKNGQYWLKPVIKPFGRHHSGEIEGKIRPVHSFGMIKAFNDSDSAFAMPWSEGEFKIRGLKEGTYSLFIDGINGYRDTTITGIIVSKKEDVKLGTIQLRQ